MLKVSKGGSMNNWDEVRAMFAETDRRWAKWLDDEEKRRAQRQAEDEKRRAQRQAEDERRWAKEQTEYEKQKAERQAEYEKQKAERQAEYERQKAEQDKRWAERDARVDKELQEMRDNFNGVNKSHGMMSENYFYRSLLDNPTFGGVHFDEVIPKMKLIRKFPDKTRIEGEYDIVLTNDSAVCLIESKYRVRKNDVTDLAGRKVNNFKILFPEYADYKFYLGIGGMSFEENSETVANELGIGIMTLNGDAVTVHDENLKVY
jgi:flagellar biosynthesis GTPase FlhF